MSKLREYLAINMKKYRKNRKMTQADLAELCDTSANYIALIETLNRFPREYMIEKIADALDVEIFELFVKPNSIFKPKNNKKDLFISKLIKFIEKEL